MIETTYLKLFRQHVVYVFQSMYAFKFYDLMSAKVSE